jgi:hypothetical protein
MNGQPERNLGTAPLLRLVRRGEGSRDGEITLNNAAPEARFCGISKSILVALETYLLDLGLS